MEQWKWQQLHLSRRGPGCGVVNGKFIVAGGYSPGKYWKSTEIVDLKSRTVAFGEDMAKRRGWFQILSIKGSLFAIGGHFVSQNKEYYLAEVEEFDDETGAWKLAKSLPGKRFDYGGVAVNRALVCG